MIAAIEQMEQNQNQQQVQNCADEQNNFKQQQVNKIGSETTIDCVANKVQDSKKQEQRYHSTRSIIFKVVIASIGFFFFGYQQGILNLSLKTLDVIFEIKEEDQKFYEGLMSCLSPVGAIIGCVISIYLVKSYSRIRSFFIIDLISLLGSIISVVSVNVYVFMLGRLISGLGVGINTALVPQYVNEISPSALKGITGCLLSVLCGLGLVVSNIQSLGYENDPKQNDDLGNFWRFAFVFPGALTLLRSIIFMLFIRNDTASYFMIKGDRKRAEAVLKDIYKEKYIEEEIQNIANEIQMQKQGLKYWKDLLSLQYFNRVKVGVFLQFLQQFSGINVVVFYSGKIFEEIVDDSTIVFVLALMTNVLQLLCAFFSAYFSTRYGRRSLLLKGDIACFTFLLVFGIVSLIKNYGVASGDLTNPIVIICVFGYMFSFGISLGPIVWAYNSEILPEKGLSVATITNWSSSIIIIFFFPMAINVMPVGYIFFFFSFWCLLGIFFIKTFVFETKNLTPQEIEMFYNPTNQQKPGQKEINSC
ncbi:hypothetical protein ABPG72_000127 [Tetrahymena utriculariae]